MLYNSKKPNLIMLTDCYNLCHKDLKQNTDWELSHIYNRNQDMLLFGFADNICSFLNHQITKEELDEAYKYSLKTGIRLPYDMFEKVINEFNGYPPLAIVTLPEGTWVPKGSPFAQVWNTEEGFGELVTWWEALLLWGFFPSACATRSLEIYDYNQSTTPNFPRFHSFGFRSMGNYDRAIQAGTAWALFNPSSDDFHISKIWPIKTIPASAHKVVQNWDDEEKCMRHAIDITKYSSLLPKPAISLVIDTYGTQQFIDKKLNELLFYAKEKGVYVVPRLDSGDVIEFGLQVLQCIDDFNVPAGIIIGEGVDLPSAKLGDMVFKEKKFNLHRVIWGMGAGFYRDLDRDYLGFAMKTAHSNNSPTMKFSDSPIKESIPGKVQTYIELNSKKLEFELFDSEWNDIPNGYNLCYFHDSQDSEPTFDVPELKDVKDRALREMPIMGKREIVIKQNILDLKEKLRTKFIS